jgi:DNA-binding NtrC family response regulator
VYRNRTASVRLLSVSPAPADHRSLGEILDDPHYRILRASSCREAIERLTSDSIALVICEADLPDGSWRDLLRHADEHSRDLTLIVASRLADTRLWAEVLHLGAYDLIAKPFDTQEVRRVVANACERVRSRPVPRAKAQSAAV